MDNETDNILEKLKVPFCILVGCIFIIIFVSAFTVGVKEGLLKSWTYFLYGSVPMAIGYGAIFLFLKVIGGCFSNE